MNYKGRFGGIFILTPTLRLARMIILIRESLIIIMIMEQADIVIIMIMEQQAGHPWRHISEVDIWQRESTRAIFH